MSWGKEPKAQISETIISFCFLFFSAPPHLPVRSPVQKKESEMEGGGTTRREERILSGGEREKIRSFVYDWGDLSSAQSWDACMMLFFLTRAKKNINRIHLSFWVERTEATCSQLFDELHRVKHWVREKICKLAQTFFISSPLKKKKKLTHGFKQHKRRRGDKALHWPLLPPSFSSPLLPPLMAHKTSYLANIFKRAKLARISQKGEEVRAKRKWKAGHCENPSFHKYIRFWKKTKECRVYQNTHIILSIYALIICWINNNCD